MIVVQGNSLNSRSGNQTISSLSHILYRNVLFQLLKSRHLPQEMSRFTAKHPSVVYRETYNQKSSSIIKHAYQRL